MGRDEPISKPKLASITSDGGKEEGPDFQVVLTLDFVTLVS